MSNPSTWLLISLPTSISPSGDKDEALTALRSSVTSELGTTYPFSIPTFKIGTLDALVQQADDLAKLSSIAENVVGKIGESLAAILDHDQRKIDQQKTINDSTIYQTYKTHCHHTSNTIQNPSTSTSGPSSGTKSSTGRTNR